MSVNNYYKKTFEPYFQSNTFQSNSSQLFKDRTISQRNKINSLLGKYTTNDVIDISDDDEKKLLNSFRSAPKVDAKAKTDAYERIFGKDEKLEFKPP